MALKQILIIGGTLGLIVYLTRPDKQSTGSSIVPYHSHTQESHTHPQEPHTHPQEPHTHAPVAHRHSFWDVEQNPHVHILPPNADTTGTNINQYMRDGSVNTQFVPGGNSSEYLGGFS